MIMKRILNILLMLAVTLCSANAQTAKQVLDKTAAALSNKGGVTASFTVTGKNIPAISGKIAPGGSFGQCFNPYCTVFRHSEGAFDPEFVGHFFYCSLCHGGLASLGCRAFLLCGQTFFGCSASLLC